MNAEGLTAIKDAIGNLQDNRYRYALAESANPGSVTGNGKPFTEVIARLDRLILKLKENLEDEE